MTGGAVVAGEGGDGGVALPPLTYGMGASGLIFEPRVFTPVVVLRSVAHVPNEVFDGTFAAVRAGLFRNNTVDLVRWRRRRDQWGKQERRSR